MFHYLKSHMNYFSSYSMNSDNLPCIHPDIYQALCNAYCGENHGSTDFDALANVRDAILRMTYYW